MLDLQNSPLGLGQGEGNLQAPFNAAMPGSRVFLVNHSATQPRQRIKVGVSFKRGAEKALRESKDLQKFHTVSSLREAAKEGEDMNVYETVIRPILFAPLWNGKHYPIPPAKSADEAPSRIQVPEGLWDLLMGNYERMHSADPREVAEESMRLAVSQTFKNSPILFVTIDGERQHRTNDFGYIEIERRTEQMAPAAIDTEFLTAMEMSET